MINNWNEMSKFWHKMQGDPTGAPLPHRIKLARECSQALFMEVAELTDSFQWKPWRKEKSVDVPNVKREIVDCLFFLHHIAECFGIDHHDLQATFSGVMANNKKRYIDGDFSEEEEKKAHDASLHEKMDSILSQLQREDKDDNSER